MPENSDVSPVGANAVSTASREGTGGPIADAVQVFTAADGTVAVALVDGIGHEPGIVSLSPILAEVAARVTATRGCHAGILTAGMLVADPGAGANPGPDAVAAVVRRTPDGTTAAWCGDVRVYGWDGVRLRQYTTDHTIGEQLRQLGVPVSVAAAADFMITVTLGRATPATVPVVGLPDGELIILTTDGIHDALGHDAIEDIVRELANEPGELATALVAAVTTDEHGDRDDATAAVLTRS